MGEAIMVGMAEVKFTQSPDDVLIALGLGSCISVCAYDRGANIAGMAHVVLPESHDTESAPGKFADTAIPFLLQSLIDLGASPDRVRVAIAGGAQLFAFQGTGVRLEIGPRNMQAIKVALERANLRVVADDLGGTAGRTVQLTGNGKVKVKSVGKTEQDLVDLGQSDAAAPAAPGGRTMSAGKTAPSLDAIRRR